MHSTHDTMNNVQLLYDDNNDSVKFRTIIKCRLLSSEELNNSFCCFIEHFEHCHKAKFLPPTLARKTSTNHYTFVLHAHKNCLYICHVV